MTQGSLHERRRIAAWERVAVGAPDASALLVTDLANIRYLTGFSGSNAVVLLREDGLLLGTDGRYVTQAAAECPGVPLLIDRDTLPAVARAHAGGSVGVEAEHLSVAQWRTLESILGTVRETSGVVESCRVVKDADELGLVAEACRISDLALALLLPTIVAGETERAIARRLERFMLEAGADALSFDTIVAGGPHTAIPHHQPTERPVDHGEFLLIDFGAEVGGYHADETRTFVIGEPADWQVELHALVLEAQQAGRDATMAGVDLRTVDRAARSVIADAGYGEEFGHGLGHGVGLQIHEAPFMSARATGTLLAGSTVTIEPGVYLPERGGVRIEDTVLVAEGPCSPLTGTERGLVALGR
ncbi:MAG: aminopeptidase P family protein [Candidatus Nanopelagicales bacterium]